VNMSANLTDDWKAQVEFWTLGINGSTIVAQWQFIALGMAQNANLSIWDTADLFFLQSNAVLDTSIAIWQLKRLYDTNRPISAIQCLLGTRTAVAWRGPYQGIGNISLSSFMPYQPVDSVSPSYAEYPSSIGGISAVSAAILRRFFNNSDVLDARATMRQGQSLIEPEISNTTAPGFTVNLTNIAANSTDLATRGYSPSTDVLLSYQTLTEAVDAAGLAAQYGGISYQVSVKDGITIGTAVAETVWERYAAIVVGNTTFTESLSFPSSPITFLTV